MMFLTEVQTRGVGFCRLVCSNVDRLFFSAKLLFSHHIEWCVWLREAVKRKLSSPSPAQVKQSPNDKKTAKNALAAMFAKREGSPEGSPNKAAGDIVLWGAFTP